MRAQCVGFTPRCYVFKASHLNVMPMPSENNVLVSRLKSLMEETGINARELAERAGVGRSFVYDILSCKSGNPTTQKLSAIAEVLGTDVNYLLSGAVDAKKLTNKHPEVISISSLEVHASMGGGTLTTEENEGKVYYFHHDWVRNSLKSNPSDLRIIFVSGDSMYPTLQDNDMVLVDLSRKTPTPPGIFVLFDGIGLVAKRLEVISGIEPPSLRIASDNPQYGAYERSTGEVNIIGRVVWFARKV